MALREDDEVTSRFKQVNASIYGPQANDNPNKFTTDLKANWPAEESSNSPVGESKTPAADTRTPEKAQEPSEGRESGQSEPAASTGSSASGDASENSAGQGKSSTSSTRTGAGTESNSSQSASSSTDPAPQFRTPRENPLSSFSSVAYKICLYMVDQDSYNSYMKTGSIQKKGTYVVAQTGGTNLATQQRMPGSTYDYYIDNLKFVTNVFTLVPNTTTNISFDVIEPMGFSFLTELANASKKINPKVQPFMQHYLLVIQFLGYDSVGNVVNASMTPPATSLEGASNNNFQKVFPIRITTAKFDLKGSVTHYAVAAQVLPDVAKRVTRAIIPETGTMNVSTVGDALAQLFEKLNNYQQKLAKTGSVKIPDVYKIEILDSKIKNAKIISGEVVKAKAGASDVQSPQGSNESASANNKDTKLALRQISYSNETIVKRIETIITISDFIGNALPEKTTETAEPKNEKNKPTEKLNWCTVNNRMKVIGWDEKRNDWAYEITYVVVKKYTPYVNSTYLTKDNTQPFLGVSKKYNYYFGGKNKEIISFAQKYNALYYLTSIASSDGNSNVDSTSKTPKVPAPTSSSNQTGGKTGQSTAIAAEVVTQLNSPTDTIIANMTILGDPDFLDLDVFAHGTKIIGPDSGKKGSGALMDASSGLVFAELSFYEGKDYDVGTGTLKINKAIKFADYPPELSKMVDGIIYQIQDVTSQFQRGKFTQELKMILVNDLVAPGSDKADSTRTLQQAEKTAPTENSPNDSRTSQTTQEPEKTVEEKPAKDPAPENDTVKTVNGSGVTQEVKVYTTDQINQARET